MLITDVDLHGIACNCFLFVGSSVMLIGKNVDVKLLAAAGDCQCIS